MKISILDYHYDIQGKAYGVAVQLGNIASGLKRRGHQVELHFRAARKPGLDRAYGGLKNIGLLRRYGHVPRLIARNVGFYGQDCRLIDNFCPDVVCVLHQYCNLAAVLAARGRGIPAVLFTETPMAYEYSLFQKHYYAYPDLGRLLEGICVRAADEVVCISDVLKGYMMRYGAPATRLTVIPNGVDHLAFKPQAPDGEVMEKLGISGRTVVGFVGTFNFFTDIERCMDSIEAVCRRHPEAVFLFVGSGETSEYIRRSGTQRLLGDRIIFSGAVPNEQVPAYLSVMDVVICPYRGDYLFYGSSMKLLEYMACGKPVVATALGQIKELITDGYNGMLFEWQDDAGMQAKLLELLANDQLRQNLGMNARKTIEAGWTWDIQIAKIECVLERAVGRGRPASGRPSR